MKYNLLSFVLIYMLINSVVYAQSIDKLDEKSGFKDFTIGDSISKWENHLIFLNYMDDSSVAYLYSGNCCDKVFMYAVDEIKLQFKNGVLISILITTKNFQKGYKETGVYPSWRTDDFENIRNSFEFLFGKPTAFDASDEEGLFSYIWTGKKVLLMSSYEFLGLAKGDRQRISIMDINYIQQSISNGF